MKQPPANPDLFRRNSFAAILVANENNKKKALKKMEPFIY
jgi:hypothetical protein